MIRLATLPDVPQLVQMFVRFAETTAYRQVGTAQPALLDGLFCSVIQHESGAVWVSERDGRLTGMLAMQCCTHPMTGERVASEIVWWVEPEHRGAGVRLLKCAEAWARDQSADLLQMIAPNARIGQFYARAGYQPVETSYIRRVA